MDILTGLLSVIVVFLCIKIIIDAVERGVKDEYYTGLHSAGQEKQANDLPDK